MRVVYLGGLGKLEFATNPDMCSRAVARGRRSRRAVVSRSVAAACASVVALSAPVAAAPAGPASGPACLAPCSARSWNSATIDFQAGRIQLAGEVKGNFVQVGTWNAYLRLAVLGNQDPDRRPYVSTYVRCWSDKVWRAHTDLGALKVTGFYIPRTAWVNVPAATCDNARKAALGELNATNVIALGTILHETFHRQGIEREDDATCLAALGVWQAANRHGTAGRADRAWAQVIGFYSQRLPEAYRKGIDGCGERGVFAWNDDRVWR